MHIFIFMILKINNQLLKKYMIYSRKSLIEIVLFLFSLSIFSYFFFLKDSKLSLACAKSFLPPLKYLSLVNSAGKGSISSKRKAVAC